MASRFAHQAIHSAEETVEQMHQVTSRILPSISIQHNHTNNAHTAASTGNKNNGSEA